jgi:hypothetical protein
LKVCWVIGKKIGIFVISDAFGRLCKSVNDRDVFYVYVTEGNTATGEFCHVPA